jgi:putative protease
MTKPELLSPIQDFTTLTTAIKEGADAVFFGVRGFNMRVSAKNFTVEDLPEIVRIAKASNVKTYLALNTIIYEEEIESMKEVVRSAHEAGVNAVICWDMAVVETARAIGMEVHLSTQASVANSASAIYYKNLGITRVVLARECTLAQVKEIKEKAGVEIEVFIHGAMCVSMSGRCFMSQFSTCHSANRGECLQPCRRNYLISDTEGQYQFEVGPNYILSPQDLCTLPFIEELVFSGINCMKIEGRNKSPEYVHDVTSVYREAIDFVWDNRERKETPEFALELEELKARLMPKLERVFNRGFSSGFYMGKPMDAWAKGSDSLATEQKVHVGKVVNYYKKAGVAEVLIQTDTPLGVGDDIVIQGETTGSLRMTIASMEIEHESVVCAVQGQHVAIQVPEPVRINDAVRKIEARGQGRHE